MTNVKETLRPSRFTSNRGISSPPDRMMPAKPFPLRVKIRVVALDVAEPGRVCWAFQFPSKLGPKAGAGAGRGAAGRGAGGGDALATRGAGAGGGPVITGGEAGAAGAGV